MQASRYCEGNVYPGVKTSNLETSSRSVRNGMVGMKG